MDLRKELRKAIAESGLTRHKVTELAKINKNALYGMDGDDWNPTLRTILRLRKALKIHREAD